MPLATHGGVVGEGPAEEQRTTLENINLNFPAFFLAGEGEKADPARRGRKEKKAEEKEARKDNNVGHRHTPPPAKKKKKPSLFFEKLVAWWLSLVP